MESTSTTIGVGCFVRTSSLVAPVDSTLRTLEDLDDGGLIDDITVDAWPAEVRLGNPGPYSDVVDLFEQFEAWAARWNVSICPPFATETHHSAITGDTREVLHTPVQCLAVYVNGVLMEVFPHSTDPAGDGNTYTVRAGLGLLEEHHIRAFGGEQASAAPPSQLTSTDVGPIGPDI